MYGLIVKTQQHATYIFLNGAVDKSKKVLNPFMKNLINTKVLVPTIIEYLLLFNKYVMF